MRRRLQLTVTRNDLNYYDLGQAVELRVSALAVPAAVNQDGAGSPAQPFRSGNLHDYGRGIYAGAVFGKKSGADELQVSERGVVSVISAGITEAGSYGIVITATSGAFLGAAEFEFALDVGVFGGLAGLLRSSSDGADGAASGCGGLHRFGGVFCGVHCGGDFADAGARRRDLILRRVRILFRRRDLRFR